MGNNNLLNRRKSDRSFCSAKPALLALAITQALAFQSTQAATIEVTSNLDNGADCTLREALATVNAGVDQLNGCVVNTGVDAIGTNDTITFDPSVAGQIITLSQGELPITKDVSINPGGVNTTIDANQSSRVINNTSGIDSDLFVTLNQLTITGGNSGGITVVNNYSAYGYVTNTVSLTLTNSTISGNTGGGILAGNYSSVSLSNNTVSGNFGKGIGAGRFSSVTLNNSTVSDNTGSGMYVNYASAYLNSSTVSGNSGTGILGGIFGDAYLTNSTVSDNSGGGIYVTYGGAKLENSTVSGNMGDGISGNRGLGLLNSTVSGNTGYGVSGGFDGAIIVNSIIANNGNGDCTAYYGSYGMYPPGEIAAGTDTISTTVCGGATITDPVLGPLTDNGGPTQTHALLAGSPAIDNGTGAGATATDQRGVAAEGVRDSGAYEFIAAANALAIEKLINHQTRQTPAQAAELLAGTRYRSDYKVTNNSPDRVYSVRVFEDGQLVCTLYDLMPGQSKQKDRCANFNNVLAGLNNVPANVTAKVSGSNQTLANQTNAYYNGFGNVPGKLKVTHYINEKTADTQGNAVSVNGNQAEVKFKVENTGSITLYRVKLYHDPASPLNSGWQELCYKGTLKPGEVRYCKRTIDVTASGLNKAFGRAQGRDSNVGSGGVVNASNPTYFIVP